VQEKMKVAECQRIRRCRRGRGSRIRRVVV